METFVRLLCPECGKSWQKTPSELPDATKMFHCPGCHASRRLSEFARTDRDLENIKKL